MLYIRIQLYTTREQCACGPPIANTLTHSHICPPRSLRGETPYVACTGSVPRVRDTPHPRKALTWDMACGTTDKLRRAESVESSGHSKRERGGRGGAGEAPPAAHASIASIRSRSTSDLPQICLAVLAVRQTARRQRQRGDSERSQPRKRRRLAERQERISSVPSPCNLRSSSASPVAAAARTSGAAAPRTLVRRPGPGARPAAPPQ